MAGNNILSYLIRLYKIIAILSWTGLTILLSAPYRLGDSWKSTAKISHFARMWNWGLARILGLHIKVYGDIPRSQAGLIVSNHLSYLDIIAEGSILLVRYSPKAEISKWPFIGWVVGLSRPIWADRVTKTASKEMLDDFAETMRRGMFLAVYPEGTSTDGTNGILPFKSAPFEAAIVACVPVFPTLVRYNHLGGSPTLCWYGDMTLIPHLWQVLRLPRIEAELHFLPAINSEGKTRKELASLTHEALSREYELLSRGKAHRE